MKPRAEAPNPDRRESRGNLRRFVEEVTLELSLKEPVGIWQVRKGWEWRERVHHIVPRYTKGKNTGK